MNRLMTYQNALMVNIVTDKILDIEESTNTRQVSHSFPSLIRTH